MTTRQTIQGLEDACDTLRAAADLLAEAKALLDTLRAISDVENYILPPLNDLIEGENRNPYNVSLFAVIRELEAQVSCLP